MPMEVKKFRIKVDGKSYETEPGKNMLHTLLSMGFDIPYFCYHPALGSVGACRQCAVKKFKNENDKKGKIVMSCMEPASEGLIISTNDDEVKAFRANIIESLMINHPHDCPICDEGGECHLQDMTVMTGHNYRRFAFKKRTYNSQYLGPYIHHEMNRCIQCYRCVRFYRDYAGGRDLHVFGSADRVYFGRHQDGKLESEFSGNLVEVCPTGVFTDNTLREHYTRKWDLTNSPSICNNCSVGCNIIVSERYGMVIRVLSRYNKDINGYFLCDRGRFGYDFINSSDRIKKIMIRSDGPENAGADPSSILKDALKGKIVGIGSPSASLESNFALETLVGKNNFYHGIAPEEFHLVKTAINILKTVPAHNPSLSEIEKADAVLILGEDPLETAPMLALAIRQASRNKTFEMAEKAGIALWHDAAVRDMGQNVKSPVIIVSPNQITPDDLPLIRYEAGAEEAVLFGSALVSAIDSKATPVQITDKTVKNIVQKTAGILMNAANPLIICGLSLKNKDLLQASANLAIALSNAGKKPLLSIIFPACNSLGLGLMDGKPVDELDEAAGATAVILENDLFRIMENEMAEKILSGFRKVIILHHTVNETVMRSDVTLPSGTFAESTGTIFNYEGRAQRYYRVLPEDSVIKDSWKHLSELISIKGNGKVHWKNFDDIIDAMAGEYPLFSKINRIIPDSRLRYFNEKIARQTSRFSGRTAMNAHITVSEPKPPDDPDSALNFSMEGYKGVPDANLVPYYWAPGWNSSQAINNYLEEPGGSPPDGNPGVLIMSDDMKTRREYFKINHE